MTDPDAIAAHPTLVSVRDVARHYVGDVVYGANDGIITTFAVVAGVAGAALSPRIVLILGFANLVADGFSMAASNFLAIRSRSAVERVEGRAVSEPFPAKHALATLVAFVVAGTVPLLAFAFDPVSGSAFAAATVTTFVTLFAVGAARSAVSGGAWWQNGVEMLAIGAAASGVSFGIGRVLAGVSGTGSA